jgi:murein DD-endopeptidase MepM/ murein hydrolase activator NlpD
MKRFDKYFTGFDGHISWTAVGVFISTIWFFIVHVTIYMLLFVMEKDVSEGALNWSLASSAQLFGSLVIRGVQGFAKHWGTDFMSNISGDGSVRNKTELQPDKKKPAVVTKPNARQIKKPVLSTTKKPFIKPCDAKLTSRFRTKERPTHHGVDFAAKGHVPILAAADGVVTRRYNSASYGQTVILEHLIDGQTWQTLYAHLKQPGAPQGQQVAQGQEIGIMGNTGRSRGQHLHFEIHKGFWNTKKSNAVNPEEWIS